MTTSLVAIHADALKAKYIALDQAAIDAELAGRDAVALACYKEIIELKIQDYGESSGETAYTLDNLGTAYAEWGELAEAEDCLVRAMKARDLIALTNRSDHEASLDAAQTHESLGRLYERTERPDDARKVRLRGRVVGTIFCGELDVSISRFHTRLLLTLHRSAPSIFPTSRICGAVGVTVSSTAARTA